MIACSSAALKSISHPLHHTALTSELLLHFFVDMANLVVCSPGAPGAPKPAPNPLQSTGTLSFAAIANSGLRPAEALTVKAPEGVRAPLQKLEPSNPMSGPGPRLQMLQAASCKVCCTSQWVCAEVYRSSDYHSRRWASANKAGQGALSQSQSCVCGATASPSWQTLGETVVGTVSVSVIDTSLHPVIFQHATSSEKRRLGLCSTTARAGLAWVRARASPSASSHL